MAGLCEGGNEPPGSLKASKQSTKYAARTECVGIGDPGLKQKVGCAVRIIRKDYDNLFYGNMIILFYVTIVEPAAYTCNTYVHIAASRRIVFPGEQVRGCETPPGTNNHRESPQFAPTPGLLGILFSVGQPISLIRLSGEQAV
ncbi:hypothetical protein ANN_06465 [Periplaneta americana]|uniref:Uncharacterized protein n=1 Tax=Periplaneta americana TaxID=6978 RepID=A0ABQ8TEH6_PERAM|nr:hypothetical protein ANN_06465 [Periplaneta americana]